MEREKGTAGTVRSIPTGLTALAVIALGVLTITACGDVDLSKKGGAPVAGDTASEAVAGSACVCRSARAITASFKPGILSSVRRRPRPW